MFVPAQDPLTSIEDGIRALMTSKLDLFVGMGLNLFRGFATILIAWFGVQSALSSAEGGEGFNFTRFTRLLLVIAFCFAMVKYYSSPIPGIGQRLRLHLCQAPPGLLRCRYGRHVGGPMDDCIPRDADLSAHRNLRAAEDSDIDEPPFQRSSGSGLWPGCGNDRLRQSRLGYGQR